MLPKVLPQNLGFFDVCYKNKSLEGLLLSKNKWVGHKIHVAQTKPYGFSDFIAEGYGSNGALLITDLLLSVGVGAVAGVILGASLLSKNHNSSEFTNHASSFKKKSWDYFPFTQKMKALQEDCPNFEHNLSLTVRKAARDSLIPVHEHLIERQKFIAPIQKKIREQEVRDLIFLLCLKDLTKKNKLYYNLPKPLIQKIMNMQWWNNDLINNCDVLIEHNKKAPLNIDKQFVLPAELAGENRYKHLSGYFHESQVPLQRNRLKNDIFKSGSLTKFKKIFRKNCNEIKKREAHLKKIVDYYSSSYVRFLPTVVMEFSCWVIPILVFCSVIKNKNAEKEK